jgi:NAD(P)-dependent dehydrogenase (short-subunit alcohol dehydrogenase family)
MKTVLITGCSSGIGYDLVPAFLHSGWRVIATMRRVSERSELFADLQRQFGEALLVKELDVTLASDREHLLPLVQQSGLDCLVNNAGYALFGALEHCSEEDVRLQMDTNFLAPVLLTRALLPALRKAKGSIINISSVMAFVGTPLSSMYSASKAALSMWSEAMRYELAGFGVRVAVVEPGGFSTRFGVSAKWGQGDAPGYAAMITGLRNFQHQLASRRKRPPTPVVRRVLRIANRHSGCFRHRVGVDAVLAGLVFRFIPHALRVALFRRGYAWVLARKATS